MSFPPSPLARVAAGALLPIVFASAVAIAATVASTRPATDHSTALRIPDSIAVRKDLGAPPAGVTELKFRDMYKMPVGPKGLEPTQKLLALDARRVRIVGYMVEQELAPKGSFLLSPLPVLISDEDESLADDLPASAILVQLTGANDLAVPHLTGLLQFTGTLHVGMRTDAASGRATPAQLVLDGVEQNTLQNLAKSAKRGALRSR